MRMFALTAFIVAAWPLALFGADNQQPTEFKGTLRTGIMAIGGETMGTIIRAKGGKIYELDFGDPKLREVAGKLNGKEVVVKGTLRVKQGIEIKERRIITVTELRAADAQQESTAAPKVEGGEAKDTGWTSLFNGKNLDGWVVKCRPEDKDKTGYWKVVDGMITAEAAPGGKHNYIWLLTEKEFGDFELKLKIQTYGKSTGNSGIQVRSRYDDEAHYLDGPQIDINPPGPWRNGFLYDETRGAQIWLWPNVGKPANAKPSHAPKGWKWSHADKQDVWNEVYIRCQGTKLKSVINGVTIADYDGAGRLDDAAHRKHNVGLRGHIGLQIHPGGEMLIRFKDIMVRTLE